MSIILSASLAGPLTDARFVALRQGEGMTSASRRAHHRRQVAMWAVAALAVSVAILFAVLRLAGVT